MSRLLDTLRRSLALRLMLWFLLTAAAVSIVLHLSVGLALRDQFESSIIPHIRQYHRYIRQEIGNPPDIERAREIAARTPVDIFIDGPARHWSSTGQAFDATEVEFHRYRGRRLRIGEWRERVVLQSLLGKHTLYLAFPRQAGRHPARLIALLSVLAILTLAFVVLRRLLRPVQQIRDGVRRIGHGDLQHRLDARRHDDLGELAAEINRMADDIQRMLEAKRELLLGISHELRTPLTRLRVATELLDDEAARQRLQADLSEMEQLLGELVEGERLNQRHRSLQRTPIDPDALVARVVEELPDSDQVSLELAAGDRTVALDEVRMRLLLRNLLSNALRHNRATLGPVQVVTARDDAGLTIEIRDHGTGIAAQHLPHLTEPFYRVDASRQRQTGGYGLGLYLCRLIAEAHGGALTIASDDNGTRVSVTLPANATFNEPGTGTAR